MSPRGHYKRQSELTRERIAREHAALGTQMALPGIAPTRKCSDISARWCAVHGDCTCRRHLDHNDPRCPLHSAESNHGEI